MYEYTFPVVYFFLFEENTILSLTLSLGYWNMIAPQLHLKDIKSFKWLLYKIQISSLVAQ